MPKIQAIGHIKEGKLTIVKRDTFNDAIKVSPEGKYWITVEKIYSKRSLSQNNALFGVPYKILQQCFITSQGEFWTINRVHTFCKENLLPEEYLERITKEHNEDPRNKIVNQETGEEITLPLELTTVKMKTTEMMEYYKNLQRFGDEWFYAEIPDPDPNYKNNE